MWNSRTLRVVASVVVSALSLSDVAFGRMRWAERDGKPVFLHPRRFGLEFPLIIDKIAAACPSAVCGILAGGHGAIIPLLAFQPECSQLDFADSIINASWQFDAATQGNMIALAKEYLRAEKNIPLDFTTNPPTKRDSVLCQRGAANQELNGLFQAQDPATQLDVFFDPALGKSVLKRSQPNTEPFGGAAARFSCGSHMPAFPSSSTIASSESLSPTPSTYVPASLIPTPTSLTTPSGNIGNFGKCSVPEIEFGEGFDNRKETSYRPVDRKSYNHGSAQNIDIISKFMCDTLVNSCGADQTARTTCASALAAADQQAPKTGAQADAFNTVFGIKTNFTAITPLDDQGRPVTSSGSVSSPSNSTASDPANFGKCSTPEIKFAVGLDGRKETAFAPVDQVSYNHGSADNIGVIAQFMCDALTNTCEANEAAKDQCDRAEAAVNAETPLTGAQADAFNAVFSQKTNFASVTPIDNTGKPVVGHNTVNPAPSWAVDL